MSHATGDKRERCLRYCSLGCRQLRQDLGAIPAFFNQITGQFDEEAYRTVLQGENMTPADLEQDLTDALGLSVSLADRGGKGELTLRYSTLEQLDDLCRRLMRG